MTSPNNYLTESLIQARKHDVELDHPFCIMPLDPISHREKFIRAAAKGSKKNQFKVDDYVHNMPAAGGLVEAAKKSGDPKPFANTSILMIHHITAEVLGCISVLRALGCKDLVTVFVGYNAEAEKAYRPDLSDLPGGESRCFILENSTMTSHDQAQGNYSVKRNFTILPEEEKRKMPYDLLDKVMKENHLIDS